jgi:hypothetical protein
MGRGARLRPPPSGAPSIVTKWPEPVSATKVMPDKPVQRTVHSMMFIVLKLKGRHHCKAACIPSRENARCYRAVWAGCFHLGKLVQVRHA